MQSKMANDTGIESVLMAFAPGDERPDLRSDALQELLNGLPEQIALLDEDWTILTANRAWTKAVRQAGHHGLRIGGNYYRFCEGMADEGHQGAQSVVRGLRQISDGIRMHFRHIYAGERSLAGRSFRVSIRKIESDSKRLVAVTRYEVTELIRLRHERRKLGRTLLNIQEEERRRIAREIHDSTAQHLVSLHIHLASLRQMHPEPRAQHIYDELDAMLDQVNREIRSMCFIYHPPPLREGGLLEALYNMATGFGRRTGLRIHFTAGDMPDRRCLATETALYRVAQEALANVHRHAEARHVAVHLCLRRCLHLVVWDDGAGPHFPDGALDSRKSLGVGILSMKSRVEDLGGRFSLRRRDGGTAVLASIPYGQAVTAS